MPLLGKVPLTMPLREGADAASRSSSPNPDDPAAQAIRQAARGIIALSPIELPVLQAPAPAAAPQPAGHVAADGGLSPLRVSGSRACAGFADSRRHDAPPRP